MELSTDLSRSGNTSQWVVATKTYRNVASKATAAATATEKSPKPLRAPSMRDSPTEMVAINVKSNTSTRCFVVHKVFICHYSSFFEAAFNSSFSEGLTQTMDFTTTSCRAFGIFVAWLYSDRLDDTEGILPDIKLLITFWLLADYIGAPKLQNLAIETMNDVTTKQGELPVETFNLVYNNTTAGSPLRCICVTKCVMSLGPIEQADQFPKEMLVDIVEGHSQSHNRQVIKLSKDKMKTFMVDELVKERVERN